MKIWLEDPSLLYKGHSFIPNSSMNIEERMNTITRLVLFIFLIMILMGYKNAILFLLLSIIFIIILYYLQKKEMSVEPFSYIQQSEDLYDKAVKEYKQNRYTIEKFPSYYANERVPSSEIIPNQSYVSKNQNIVGPANPKTLVAPVVAPPSYDWTYWRANDFVFPSIINEKRTQDFYGSGYYTSDEPLIENYKAPSSLNRDKITKESYEQVRQQSDSPYYENEYVKPYEPIDTLGYYNGKHPTEINNGNDLGSSNVVPKDYLRKKNPKLIENNFYRKTDGTLKYPGDVNKSCTYDPTNLDYDLPTNFMAGNCERNKNVKGLNNEIFTSTITPGVYYKTQIIEPLNSNIGISFDQQMPTRYKSVDQYGNITYTAMDPSLYEPVKQIDKNDYGTAPYEVYDPRTNGYGSSDREYQHDLTGQPRFYYDDVNAARRPNYITRTNIDHLLKADSYGVVQDRNDIMSRNCNSRQIAEDGILQDTLDHRTDLMTRLMRKTNSEMWQQRLAPIHKGANFVMR
jgi:hypothetical protein